MSLQSDDGDKISSQVNGATSVATPNSLHSDIAADRIAFLSSFSPEEDKAIRRKVDWRFLWLIGMMYIIKNVSQSELTNGFWGRINWNYRLITQMQQVSKFCKLASRRTF